MSGLKKVLQKFTSVLQIIIHIIGIYGQFEPTFEAQP